MIAVSYKNRATLVLHEIVRLWIKSLELQSKLPKSKLPDSKNSQIRNFMLVPSKSLYFFIVNKLPVSKTF